MAAFGVVIAPGKPYIYMHSPVYGRLHVSMATLGNTQSEDQEDLATLVCTVGDKTVHLCSLKPGKNQNCSLNLEFEELYPVTFSVEGQRSIHLTGFYYGETYTHPFGDGDSDDPNEVISTDSNDDDSYY